MVRQWHGLIVGFGILLSSCLPDQQVAKSDYFNLDSLLKKQVEILITTNPTINKTVKIGEEVEQQSVQFDSLGWTKELSVFSQMDPNKPSNVNAFMVQRSGSKVTFSRKDPSEQGLLLLSLTYNGDDLVALSGTHFSETSVYIMEQELSMSIANDRISTYNIQGFQKMIYMDSTKFDVSVQITH